MTRRSVLVTSLLVLPLLLHADAATPAREVAVALDGLADVAILLPYDPRAEPLAQRDGPVEGLWSGRLAGTGGLVRLVEGPGYAVALVEAAPGEFAWATLVEGALVPLDVPTEDVEVDSELRAPATELAPASSDSHGDGKVQLLVDADRAFGRTFGANAGQMQLAIVSLVDAIYQVNLDVEVEVVEQHVWTTDEPLTGKILCTGESDDLLRQFRDHYEATRPTLWDVREESLVFTTKTPAPHPSGGTLIGCGYIYELESSWAYASARIAGTLATQGLDLPLNVLLTAHEMGHNFGGLHERAMPTPYQGLDYTRCNAATIMYPYLCRNQPTFSDAHGLPESLLESLDVMHDGGNAPWMREFAGQRI